ncbi:hypothetical protein [Shimia sediminis]|uniref:hypothetical protein n=1 Tax=Shimia sediminis TaxID=2497945 RepID=UPI000F8ECB79|nr:hypothetical protein [Shimia sediminis]
MANTTAKIEAALPYVLPVLGGLLGVIWVNLNKFEFINPVFAIVIGVVLGRLAALLTTRLMRKARRKER